ncbi:sulfotransferase family protein [Oligoflexus tunisiensis]|uniref:sulfotransferase family protein n=1 Tax=Oligoflexus tunisiensis TaxID=708132 RepID=UPI00114CFA17|nr:sulfotransferase [Oligoflexus tunisiensis]
MRATEKPPIFVIGTGRSGTTLMRLMLCAHPRIYISHEASFYVWDALYARGRNARDFLRYYVQTFSFRWLGIDPTDVLRSVDASCPRDKAHQAFTATMRLKAAQYNKPRWGDKTPSHTAYLRKIFADYPDARVIHMVRDPRGVVMSLSRMPWASDSLVANSLFCETARAQVEPFKDRVIEVKLEDLLAEPRATMQTVLDFVDEPWDDAVLNHSAHLPDTADMPPFEWLEGAARERSAPKARWQDLSALDIRLIEYLNRKGMKAYGYKRAVLDTEPSRVAMIGRFLQELPEALRFAFCYARLGWHIRRAEAFESPLAKRLLAALNPAALKFYPGEMPDPPALKPGWELSV